MNSLKGLSTGSPLLGQPFEDVSLDSSKGETRTPEFLRLNPRGQVPVIRDGRVTVWDSQAILVYLARKYAGDWLPLDPESLAETMQWLAVSENEVLYGLAYLRAARVYGIECDMERVREWSDSILHVIEHRLAGAPWLAASRPTVAAIACFPYVALSWQGGVDLGDYPAIGRWIGRIRSLPGFVAMEGLDPPA